MIFPGYQQLSGSCFERVRHLEEAFQQEINDHRFTPYFSLHEFESLLFTAPESIASRFSDADYTSDLYQIRRQVKSPEEINDDPKTAPSKRLLSLIPHYRKIADGLAVIKQIDIGRIRTECRHFHEWLEKLESLSA
jgi:hypothetical protein